MAKSKQINSQKVDMKKLVKELRKHQDHQGVMLAEDIGQPPFYLSTGDDVLDLYISNTKHGGVAGGRITEISGLQQSGKSLLCAHLVKSCQQLGGIPIIIDTQAATSWKFLQAIGVDIENVIYYNNLGTIQKIHKVTEQLMHSVRLQMPDTPMLIVVDSITAASTQKELQNKEYQNKGYLAALKAKMNSEALRKLAIMTARQNVALVYTSQVRVKMDVANPYMDPYESSSGGKALQFYASTRVRLQKKSKQKQKIHGVQTVVGIQVKARLDKSRLGASNRDCQFTVYYHAGIDNYTNWLKVLKDYKVIDGKGTKNIPWVVKFEGKQITIHGNFYDAIRKDEKLREQIYDIIAQLLILKYRPIEEVQQLETIEQQEG